VAVLGSGLFIEDRRSHTLNNLSPEDLALRRIARQLNLLGVELDRHTIHFWATLVEHWPSVEQLTDFHNRRAIDLCAHGWAIDEVADLLGCAPVCVSNAVHGARTSGSLDSSIPPP
jgi:transposase-like protein